jgi:hypothetical protein
MKTAMQLMLEDLELRYKVLSNAEMLQACGAIEGTIEYAKSLIIKEKEQIIKSWNNGYSIGCVVGSNDYTIEDEEKDNGNYYYNQTYNKPIL